MKHVEIAHGNSKLEAVVHMPGKPDIRTVFIMCHGFRGSRDGGGRAVLLADEIAGMGFSVVRFNFTPLQSLSAQVEEIGAIVKYCQDHIGGKIILLGRSMGGSAAAVYASKAKNISGLCLWSTPWNLTVTFQLALGDGYKRLEKGQTLVINDEFGHLQLTKAFIDDFKKIDLPEYLRKLDQIPVLVLHGSQDEIVGLDQAEYVYQILQQPKEFKVISGGNHQLAEHSQEASMAVRSWLRRQFMTD